MKKERKAKIATLLVLAGALGIVLAQRNGFRFAATKATSPQTEPSPQDAIYSMLDAAREGKVAGYLASWTGDTAASLERSAAEMGEAAFAKYLKESNAAIKGIAINEPRPVSGRELKVRVEYVYQDRNEAQFVYLEKTPAGWKIARAEAAERVKTAVPYGTPVE